MMIDEEMFTGPLEPLVPPRGAVPGMYLAAGPRELPAWTASALCPALVRGQEVLWIDAGNAFPAYAAARAARRLGHEPRMVLSRIRLARPFTAFQLEAMLRKLSVVVRPGRPVVLSDPLELFYDEEMKDAEVWRAFHRFLLAVRSFPGILLTLVVDRKPPAGRERLHERLVGPARGLAQLEQGADGWRLTPVYKRVVATGRDALIGRA